MNREIHKEINRKISKEIEMSNSKFNFLKKFFCVFFLIFFSIFFSSCAITNKKEIRQDIVSEREIELMSYVREGMYYFKNNRYLAATQSFERALQISDNAKTRYNLALALERLGDTDKALSIMTELYYNYPENINFKMASARMLDLVGKKDDAISIYNEVLESLQGKEDIKDYRYKTYRRLSDLYFNIGDLQEAKCYSQMAYNEKLTRDELLRHARLMLSVSAPIKEIHSFTKLEAKNLKAKRRAMRDENKNENKNNESNINYEIDNIESEMGDINTKGNIEDDCRLESIFAWDFLDDFKQNEGLLVEIIECSKECLNKKDPYMIVLMVLENIVVKLGKSSNNTIFQDDEENALNIVSDATLIKLPSTSYKHLERFFPILSIAKN
ncbi:MAG: tetratricopeptide repeat protein [Bdellovibrionota bacterium]